MKIAIMQPYLYFYPSLNTLPYVKQTSMPVSESISKSVLCLPLYVGLEEREIQSVSDLINKSNG